MAKGLGACVEAEPGQNGDFVRLGFMENNVENFGAYCADNATSGCTFKCTAGSKSCFNAELFCGGFKNPDSPCTAECVSAQYNCENAKLFCGRDHNCEVTTTNGVNMQITCPRHETLEASVQLSCSVTCRDGQYACKSLNVFSPDPTVPLSVSVGGGGSSEALKQSDIQCPSSAKCDVDVGSTEPFQYAGQSLNVNGGRNAEVTVHSARGLMSMQNAVIECSDFARCLIRCYPGQQYVCEKLWVNQNKNLLTLCVGYFFWDVSGGF